MSRYEKLDNIGHRIYAFLTNPKVVKISSYAAMVTFLVGLTIGIILAQLDPDGFNFVNNFISDLGSYNHTPFPKFLDDVAMYTALFLLPLTFYMEKKMRSPKGDESSLMRDRLASLGFITAIIGVIGLWGIGFFSEDVGGALGPVIYSLNWHSIFSAVVFLGCGSSGMFYGILIFFYPTIFPRPLGVYMIFVPFTLAVVYLLTIYIPLEWILLLSLFAFLIPSGLISIRHAERELGEKESKEKQKKPFKEVLISNKNKLHDFLTKPIVIKRCLLLFNIVFIPSIIIGYIVAFFLDPDSYSIIANMISDLGSLNHTPIPKFLDDAAMFSAIVLIPVIFYLKKSMCTASQIKDEKIAKKIVKLVLSNFALIFGLGAIVGFFGIGFFSEDLGGAVDNLGVRIMGLGTHFFFSIFVFGCLCITGLFVGAYLILFPKTVKEKFELNMHWILFVILGIIMIIWPPTHAIAFLFSVAPSRAFHEWFMLFAIIAWVVPTFHVLKNHAKKEIDSR